MAMPTWQGAGTVTGSTTTLTPTMPSGIAADDILLLVNNSEEDVGSPTLSPSQGFVLTASSPQDPISGGAAEINVWWKRAVGSDSAPTITNAGNHNVAVVCLIRGVKTSGDPWNTSSGGTDASSDTSMSITGATTAAGNCLVVAMFANGRSTSNNLTSGPTNADLATLTKRIDTGVAVGDGGYLIVITGEKAAAGAYGATTGGFATNEYEAFITLALEGASVAATPGGMILLRSG